MGTKRSGIQPILTFLSIFCIHILLHTFLVHSVFYRGGGGLSQRVDEGAAASHHAPKQQHAAACCLPAPSRCGIHATCAGVHDPLVILYGLLQPTQLNRSVLYTARTSTTPGLLTSLWLGACPTAPACNHLPSRPITAIAAAAAIIVLALALSLHHTPRILCSSLGSEFLK